MSPEEIGLLIVGAITAVNTLLGLHTTKKAQGLTDEQALMLRDLHVWHNAKDADGAFRWMVPPGLTKCLLNLDRTLIRIDATLRGGLDD